MSESYRFQVIMAGISFAITVRNLQTKNYCRAYMTEGDPSPAFELFMEEEDIVREWRSMLESGRYTSEFVNHLPGYYFEIFALHKKAAAALLSYDVIVFHGSAVALDGKAYLFAAGTGEGKSTHARLWTQYFGDTRCCIINDDKPFLRFDGDQVQVYGSPWAGKHQKQRNMHAPLTALCILNRDTENHIERAAEGKARELCLPHLFSTGDAEKDQMVLDLVNRVLQNVPVYTAGCDISERAVETVAGVVTRPQQAERSSFLRGKFYVPDDRETGTITEG